MIIPLGNNVWLFYIQFLQIVEILCGTGFTNIDLLLLQDKINTFFPKYMGVFPNIIMKPNGHFLQHYPVMIRKFGPLIKTLRFESNNGYFKSAFQSNKNRKNVCYSMAERHQMLMYIHYAKSSLLDFKESQGICTKEVTLEVLEPVVSEAIEDAFNFEEGEILC